MIKLITLVLQMVLLKKSLAKAVSPFEFVERSADKARGYFLFTLGCLISILFLVIGAVVAIIAVGLQLEQNGQLSFSGLMISASLFVGLAFLLFILSLIALVIQKQKMLERKRLQDQQHSTSHVGGLMEDILKQILMNLAQRKTPKNPEDDRPAQG